MSMIRSALLGALWLAVAVGSALAHQPHHRRDPQPPRDPRIAVTVEPVPASATLSRAAGASGLQLVTYASWRVTVTNGARNDLNRVFFDGTIANAGSTEAVAFDSVVPTGLTCTGLGTARLQCSLPSLPPGASTSFFAVARTPLTGTRLDVAWRAGGDEGKGRGKGCCDLTGTASTALVDPTTDASFLREVKTFVKPDGGVLFTGNEAVSTTVDGWTTLVKVPPFTAQPQTTAAVLETPVLASCAPYALAGGCFVTDVTIPGAFQALEIQFRWDKTLFKLGYYTKPEQVKLFYEGSLGRIELNKCALDQMTYGSAPTSGRPCLIERPRRITSHDTPNAELWGDLLFRVSAVDNGRYAN